MFALGFEYLGGRAVAATGPRLSDLVEWPPDATRLFMALVAGSHEGRRSHEDPAEQMALTWLEGQNPPEIAAGDPEAFFGALEGQRSAASLYVPCNDTATFYTKGFRKDFTHRNAERAIHKSAYVGTEPFYFVWSHADPPETVRTALANLCGRVTYLGQSSSFVRVCVAENVPPSVLVPATEGPFRLRVPCRGLLAQLDADFARGARPNSVTHSVSYGPPPAKRPGSVFDPERFVVLGRIDGVRPGPESTLQVIRVFRNALLAECPVQPCPEVLSGHAPGGGRSERPHLMLLPMLDVGHDYADGHLLGLGMVLPRTASAEDQEVVQGALNRWLDEGRGELRMPCGVATFDLEARVRRPLGLTVGLWSGGPGARKWTSVTPVLLDDWPKSYGDRERVVARACTRIGLPAPVEVLVTQEAHLQGVPGERDFPQAPSHGGLGNRHQRHVVLGFKEPVQGPISIGAGRYRGYGLLQPLG